MQASTNTQELPGRRAGRRKLLAVSAALVMALAALLLTLALSSSMEPSNAAVQRRCPTLSFSLTTNCLAIRTTPLGSGITPMAIPLPKRQMAPRSSLQVRAGGTRRRTPLRAAVTTPLGAPRERSKHRDHGELLTSDRLSSLVDGGGWDRISKRKGGKDHLDRLPSQGF